MGPELCPQGDESLVGSYKPAGLVHPDGLVGELLMKIGDDYLTPINNGVFRWTVPTDGELTFLINDWREITGTTAARSTSASRRKRSPMSRQPMCSNMATKSAFSTVMPIGTVAISLFMTVPTRWVPSTMLCPFYHQKKKVPSTHG